VSSAVHADAIPLELRECVQWVIWRAEQRAGRATKVPYRATERGGRASSTDPATWSSFDAALTAYEAGRADGVGFVFTDSDPYFGLDLDAELSEADRAAIVLALNTYTEWSPSGEGMHVVGRGSLNGSGRHPVGLGVFDRGRYFTFTGAHVTGTPETIEECSAPLDELLVQFLPARAPSAAALPAQPVDLDDRELLERAFAAGNGATFGALWSGEWQSLLRYGSQSEADLALCSMLAFWTGRDPARMDRLFRASGLHREKWEQREDYRERTIEAAIAGTAEVYERLSNSSRPGWGADGARSAPTPPEKGVSAIAPPRPALERGAGRGAAFSGGGAPLDLVFVEASVFATEDEPGAAALVGSEDDNLIPENADVMIYGEGGAGKTTIAIDASVHLAAGDAWLGIAVARPARVGLVENEGARPLFRRKLRRKLSAWTGSPLAEGRLLQLAEPWGRVSLESKDVRRALAEQIAVLALDVVVIGPITRSGMNEAGTLQEVRDYLDLFAEVRARSGRRVTFILIHHENRGGQVSGAWEGAVDTLFHVQAQGNGRTRLFVQKARWGGVHHKETFQLAWASGEGFELLEQDERDDNTVADEILAFVLAHGSTGWSRVDEAVAGKRERLRTIRDSLLDGGRLLNRGSEARMQLWHADDPALPPVTSDQASFEEQP
jgi:hypothetical protein